VVTIKSIGPLKTKMNFDVEFKKADGTSAKTKVLCRIDTEDEMNYFKNGGIMNFVLRRLKG
jgi:aconitate hydratase